ncbi:ribonuclease III [Leptolyngbya sp. FACHB-541]|uniref:ribonuclease III n=1 Tax=Leptolyngbya sp. FACHB-541 TaxID=2692810 RepID=UPI00168333DA|nr:ribonuclease III [Leptolyngbya sp. FACHB-541]MBD1997949.1 ribonuclease III [Leptolyngbya sp. FACHB-541]
MTIHHSDQVGKALCLLKKGLYPYIEQKMQRVYRDTWLVKAEACLPQGFTLKRTIQETLREDVSALLMVVSRQWDKVFKTSLSHTDRALVSELIEVRNKWAHQTPFSTEDLYRVLDSASRLLTAIDAPETKVAEQQRQDVLSLMLQERSCSSPHEIRDAAKESKVRDLLHDLLEQLPFQNALLLYRALTHRTYVYEHPTETEGDNEQLEFLGDSVLGFLAGQYLYRAHPGQSEEALTKGRSNLVDNQRLAEFATTWSLGKWMFLGNGEASMGGRTKPSLLSNTFEAVIGAYYLDSSMEAVRVLVEPLFIGAVATTCADPKGKLQQYAQKEYSQIPEYVVLTESGPDHDKIRVVEVRIAEMPFGQGTARGSKQAAEKEAAIDALKRLVLC